MNDPHVESLRYQLNPTSVVSFSSPPDLVHETEDFVLTLSGGQAVLRMKTHFALLGDALAVADRFLKAWELDVTLREGRKEIAFEYIDAAIVDRDPPPLGSVNIIDVAGIASASAFGTATVIAARPEYPQPPKTFVFNSDVEMMWHRYEGYINQREPIQGMAYFCLTLLEVRGGGYRDGAAKRFRVDRAVLDQLGDLASTRGDAETARKVKGLLGPLTPLEKRWIEDTIKLLIRRVGEIEANPNAPIIGLGDLPNL